MEKAEIKSIIESLIFVSEEPMSLDLMVMVLEDTEIAKSDIKAALEEIKEDYNENPDRGIQIIEVAGGYQYRTKQRCAEWIQRLNIPKPIRLSQAAMETLSIIAYRQPTLRSDIENIRGVDSGGVLKTLLERGLIRIVGKSDEVGHPLVYGTTKAFLEMFSLNSLKELPTLKEIDGLSVKEKVGSLGKAELDEGVIAEGIAEGIAEVIEEYKDDIAAYTPDLAKAQEDGEAIQELADSIKKLKRLEKEVFPKPTEQITAVPRETDETASPQDISEGE